MCHADIILFTGLKHLAHFSLIKSLIRSYLPPINNLATCDQTGIPRHFICCAAQVWSATVPLAGAAPQSGAAPALQLPQKRGCWDRAAPTKRLALVILLGITRKWVRALPHTSGVWITLSCILFIAYKYITHIHCHKTRRLKTALTPPLLDTYCLLVATLHSLSFSSR